MLERLVRVLPEQTMVYSDMTQIAYTAIDYLPLEHANSWHHPTGYGTLGYALPAATGGAIANPERPVLVIAGDAGIQYTMQELPLAAELGLNLRILLWNNGALQQIRDDMTEAAIPPTGVIQKNPDFELLAHACGWEHAVVNRLDDLDDLLVWLFAPSGPRLLELKQREIFSR